MKCIVCDTREEYRDGVCYPCMREAGEDPDLEEYHELVAAKTRFDMGGGFAGFELKESYFRAASTNLRNAEPEAPGKQVSMFAGLG